MKDKNIQDVLIFKALSDEKRLSILALLRKGEHCACYLNEQLHLKQSALSYHMKILCSSGLVTARQQGKWTYYKINASGSAYAMERLKQITSLNFNQTKFHCE